MLLRITYVVLRLTTLDRQGEMTEIGMYICTLEVGVLSLSRDLLVGVESLYV